MHGDELWVEPWSEVSYVRVTYDEDADAAYVSLVSVAEGEAVRQRAVPVPGRGEIVLDFDSNDQLLGIEILEASDVMPARFFQSVRLEPPG